jgi:cytochrome c-type biogenesis protein CcmH/NrfG
MPIRMLGLTVFMLGAALSANAQFMQPVCPPRPGEDPNAPVKLSIQGRIIAPGVTWDSYTEVLLLTETQLIGYGYTNSTGEYKLPEQEPGLYTVVVRIDGFKEYKDRLNVFGCHGVFPNQIFMEPEDVPVPQVILDFTGEVDEVVDVAELKRQLPRKVVQEFERARENRLRGEPEVARRRLEKLLMQEPGFYDARNVLGSIYLEMKLFREAEAEYNKARDLRPNSAAPLVSLGALYMQEADATVNPIPGIAGVIVPGENLDIILSDARDVLEQAIKLKPDASFAYYLLGVAHFRGNSFAKSEETLRKALALESQLRWARLALGNLYMKQNKWQEALAEFDAYLAEFKKVSNRRDVEEVRKKVAVHAAKAPR